MLNGRGPERRLDGDEVDEVAVERDDHRRHRAAVHRDRRAGGGDHVGDGHRVQVDGPRDVHEPARVEDDTLPRRKGNEGNEHRDQRDLGRGERDRAQRGGNRLVGRAACYPELAIGAATKADDRAVAAEDAVVIRARGEARDLQRVVCKGNEVKRRQGGPGWPANILSTNINIV